MALVAPPGSDDRGCVALKVLHVWDTGGAGTIIGKYMDRAFGSSSRVVTRTAFDRYGLSSGAYPDGRLRFLYRVLTEARRADVVHIHALDSFISQIRRFHPRKPVVIYYHGGDILGRWEEKRRRWERADFIGYSTPDLADGAPERARYVPFPVDLDRFRPDNDVEREPLKAVSRHYGMDAEAKTLAQKMGLELEWMENVPLSTLPSFLSRFGWFLDLRRREGSREPIKALGHLACEALACGSKVAMWDGSILETMPPEHDPTKVADDWRAIYERLMPK